MYGAEERQGAPTVAGAPRSAAAAQVRHNVTVMRHNLSPTRRGTPGHAGARRWLSGALPAVSGSGCAGGGLIALFCDASD